MKKQTPSRRNGEVYRAKDMKLGREIGSKFSPQIVP